MRKLNLASLSLLFLRIGNSTVGGGDVAVAALQRELTTREWLRPEQFGIAYGLSRITPGTNMLACCAAMAWSILGLGAALLAVLAVSVPSSVIAVLALRVCEAGDSIPWLGAAVRAMVASAVGIMVGSALLLTRSQVRKSGILLPVLFVAGAVALRLAGLSPLAVITVCAIVGLFWKQA